jgi:hypothetical protein
MNCISKLRQQFERSFRQQLQECKVLCHLCTRSLNSAKREYKMLVNMSSDPPHVRNPSEEGGIAASIFSYPSMYKSRRTIVAAGLI